ncbi:uncharacterized protein LOC124444131 isoform X2 [Xenia sp. Carnegie-2017]|uniref:uncharacterized protein LOC124444131 isoform X2 n=1 Tax=Xenia sp. Carnegie-2017 TaxID=2897299 RepID=UPI001F05007D|nr:uncharacterized protein LOC124444131 isoform X2 [Xenia sp. Carnegie-2017]
MPLSFSYQNSFSQNIKSSSRMTDIHDKTQTDHSIFIGYGSNAKLIKDRWEASKRQLRFDNNYVALKWLLDNFVDDYLRSKNLQDTATLIRHQNVTVKKERIPHEASTSHSRRAASRSPSKTRFEDMAAAENSKENGIKDRQSRDNWSELRHGISNRKSAESSRMSSDDFRMSGQHSYKYIPDYWSPYYHWPTNIPMNSRMMSVGSIPGYPEYMIKTPSCSSLPTRDSSQSADTFTSATSESFRRFRRDEREHSLEKKSGLNRGLKFKSMPNLQSIPKDSDLNSDEEEESLSDSESQGDLMFSSLSMPNLRKIPPDRTPLNSPPTRERYQSTSLLRSRHNVSNPSSLSMPNLQAIPGSDHDNRKKTIREFVMNRLSGVKEHDSGELNSKIYNPNGFYAPSAMMDSERKLVIRERLLNRMAKRKREETNQLQQHNGALSSSCTSHLKFAPSTLSLIPERRLWSGKNFSKTPTSSAVRTLDKNDRVDNNKWKFPDSEQQSKNMWNRSPVKKVHVNPGIWNPADVHVKRETLPTCTSNDVTSQRVVTSSVRQEEERTSRPLPKLEDVKEQNPDGDNEANNLDGRTSENEEEHVDVENVKEDEMEGSGESDSEVEDDTSDDDRKNKRTRKTEKPRKRLKAV